MKFKIGKLEVETSEAFGTAAFEPYMMKHLPALGRTPRAVYYYDCRLGRRNPKKPTYLVVEQNMTTLTLTPAGNADRTATDAVGARLLSESKLADSDAINAALNNIFPPVAFPIPWKRLERTLRGHYSVRVYAWIRFFDRFVTPTHGPVNDRYVLSYPVAADFVATAVGVCPMEQILIAPPADATGTAARQPTSGDPKTFADEFTDDLADRMKENADAMRRLARRVKAKQDQTKAKYRERLRADLEDILDEMDDD